ncbi:protein GOLVEN 5-like [Arachis stenosperma]|uniref:protein GOLVEN 5-like n=1 Tax=Arachis stenosperma TaxID=217475 RepID=UPI0025AB84C0|nr:protein GOLVEN 5-like [Arachis stenosperma]
MVMVMLKRSIFCVLFLLLCASCFSNARLHPSGGAEVNVIPVITKVSVVNTSKVMRDQVEIEGNLMNKKSGKENVRKYVKKKRSLRSRLGGEIVDGEFVAFTADYHSPRHHPPKNNK